MNEHGAEEITSPHRVGKEQAVSKPVEAGTNLAVGSVKLSCIWHIVLKAV